MPSARSPYKKAIGEKNFLATTTASVKGNTQPTELEPSLDDTQHASVNNVANLAIVPSTDLSICTDEQFLAHLNEKRNIFNESLKLRLRFLAAKNQDPKLDLECRHISDELERATSTRDMFKRTMSSLEDSNSCVQLGKNSDDSEDKKDLSKLQLTSDIPHYKDGHNSRDFLENMKQTVSSFKGDKRFAKDCHQYLRYLTANTRHHTKLTQELDKLKETPTWEKCESLFIKVTMDQQQRIDELINLLNAGMKTDETYSQFSHRVARDIRIYGISDNNEIIFAHL